MADLPQTFLTALGAFEWPAVLAAALFVAAVLLGAVRIVRQPGLLMNNLRPGATPMMLAVVLVFLGASLAIIGYTYS